MKEYFMTLISVVIFSSVIGMIGGESGAKKYIRLISSLCVLCAILSPMASLLLKGEPILDGILADREEMGENYVEIYHNAVALYEIEYAENVVKESIAAEFSLPSSGLEVDIKVVLKNGILTAEEIWVTLRDSAVLADPKRISEWVRDATDSPCVIVYD